MVNCWAVCSNRIIWNVKNELNREEKKMWKNYDAHIFFSSNFSTATVYNLTSRNISSINGNDLGSVQFRNLFSMVFLV